MACWSSSRESSYVKVMAVAMIFYLLNSEKLTGRHTVWSLTILAVRDLILYGNQRLVGYASRHWNEFVMLG